MKGKLKAGDFVMTFQHGYIAWFHRGLNLDQAENLADINLIEMGIKAWNIIII